MVATYNTKNKLLVYAISIKNNIKKPFNEDLGDSVIPLLRHFIKFVINEFKH